MDRTYRTSRTRLFLMIANLETGIALGSTAGHCEDRKTCKSEGEKVEKLHLDELKLAVDSGCILTAWGLLGWYLYLDDWHWNYYLATGWQAVENVTKLHLPQTLGVVWVDEWTYPESRNMRLVSSWLTGARSPPSRSVYGAHSQKYSRLAQEAWM